MGLQQSYLIKEQGKIQRKIEVYLAIISFTNKILLITTAAYY